MTKTCEPGQTTAIPSSGETAICPVAVEPLPRAPGGVSGAAQAEARRLVGLATPVIGTQLGLIFTGFIDTLMVSRLGTTELGAVGSANVLFWFFTATAMGVVQGVEPIISQAHGAGRHRETGLGLQTALAVAAVISVPLVLIVGHSEPLLLLLRQPPEAVALASEYNAVRSGSIPALMIFTAMRQYLQGRGMMSPPTWVTWVANALNGVLNWALIWGHLGLPALGLRGAALASLLTSCSLPVLLGALMWKAGLHRGAWPGWTPSALSPRRVWRLLRLGVPIGTQLALEVGSFSAATAMAGTLGVTAMAAHQVAMQLTALSFMVPQGLSMAAATRVGNLVGRGDLAGARRAARTALGLGLVPSTLSALCFVGLRWQLPRLFDAQGEMLELAATILPIAGAFQLVDGLQVVGGGALRGMGRTTATAWVNLVGWGALALPTGYVLSARLGWGLPGVWLGLSLGLCFAALSLASWALVATPRRV